MIQTSAKCHLILSVQAFLGHPSGALNLPCGEDSHTAGNALLTCLSSLWSGWANSPLCLWGRPSATDDCVRSQCFLVREINETGDKWESQQITWTWRRRKRQLYSPATPQATLVSRALHSLVLFLYHFYFTRCYGLCLVVSSKL